MKMDSAHSPRGERRQPCGFAWLALALILLAAGWPAAGARGRKGESVEELMNPLLGPEHSLWLAGPIARMASDEEVEAYKTLVDDAAAAAFIEEFWRRRDPEPDFPRNPRRELFDQRAEEADRLFRESGVPGRRTDRGTIFVLYGPPEEEEFEISPHPDDPAILVWKYPRDAAEGLDGQRPERIYRFIKRGDLTTFYTRNRRPPRPRPFPPRSARLGLRQVGPAA